MLKLFLILFALYAVRNIYLKLNKPDSQKGPRVKPSDKPDFKKPDAVDVEYKEVDSD